ncbi:MAG: SU10 major capsid protein [Candidatus Heimdallarchaeaceae archaeon]
MENGNYAVSFLDMPNHTCYSNPMGVQLKGVAGETTLEAIGNKFKDIALKALDTQAGGSGTAGYGMIPVNVDPRIVDVTRKYTPLVELVPRVTNQGMFADYNQLTAKGGGVTAIEDAVLTDTTTTYDRKSTAIKYLYAIGRVTGPAKAGMPSWILGGLTSAGGATGPFNDSVGTNAKQLEILVKAREIRELEENLIVNGDASTDATQFSGIVKLMSTTNTVDKNTSAMTLDDIDTAVRYAFDDGGRPNLAVCSSGVFQDLLGLLTAKIGYMQPTKEVFWGFSTIVLNTMVGQIPVIPSQYLTNVSGSKAIYFLDMSVVEMRVLQDMTYEDFGKNNDSDKFMLKVYETLIIKNTAFCSSITEISA